MNPETFKPILLKILDQPENFDSKDTNIAIEHLATPDAASPAQIGAFLTALKMSGRQHSPETLAACARVMMSHAVPAQLESPDDFCVDIVGTGGDGHDTFNVSTSAAIVAAGAGARVVKHGNKASTSTSGSADILRALGCSLPAPTASPLPKIPFTFLLASHYHPAMALIAPHRKQLPFRTLFNVIGPLINPARPQGMVLGVADPALGPVFADVLKDIGVRRAWVVCGKEKLDEISIAGATSVWSLDEKGNIEEFVVEPALFGLSSHPLKDVAGSSPEENARLLSELLTPNQTPIEPSNGASAAAIRDFILLNAAALLFVAGVAASYSQGVELARESVTSGSALRALDSFRSIT